MSENAFWLTFWAIVGMAMVALVGAATYANVKGQAVELERLKTTQHLQSSCIAAGGSFIDSRHCIQQAAKSAQSNQQQ